LDAGHAGDGEHVVPMRKLLSIFAWVALVSACGQTHGPQVESGVAPMFCWQGDLPAEGFPPLGAAFQPSASGCGGDPCMTLQFAGDPRCVMSTPSCAACASAGPCVTTTDPTSPNDLSRMFCTVACSTSADCAAGHTCAPRFTAAFEGGPYCVPDAVFLAVGGCRSDADCHGGETCDSNAQRCCPGAGC
jgi:hypothetical protein